MREEYVRLMIRHAFDFYDWMPLQFVFKAENELLAEVATFNAAQQTHTDLAAKLKVLEKQLKANGGNREVACFKRFGGAEH